MWIQQVILDGFKSYAHRKVIGPFDREFNAITGLNGSGKSNILDAICFVFAISQANIHKVRVKDPRELIYKSGQAGITKASVTIDFDNRDEDGKPPGFRDCDVITVSRQIVMDSRSKFFINGTTAQLSQVQNLFHSVQLNVNNPHFLIMQGTITKVLNMQPPERLSMLEEAAGTRMFEQKKTSAQLMVQKKDHKLAEIDRQLEEEMKPTLQKRENDRQEYDKYLQSKTLIDQLSRMKMAYDHEQLEQMCQDLEDDANEAHQLEQSIANKIKEIQSTIQELAAEIESLRGAQAAQLSSSYGAAQKEYDILNKDRVTKTTEVKHIEDEIKAKTADIKRLTKEKAAAEKAKVEYLESVAKAKQDVVQHDNDFEECDKKVENLTRQLQLLKSGIQASSTGVSLTEQIDRFKKQLIATEGAVKRSAVTIKQSEVQLKEKRGRATSDTKEYNQLIEDLKKAKEKLETDENKLRQQSGGYDPARERELRDLLREKSAVINELEREVLHLQTFTQQKMDIQFKRGSLPENLEGHVKGVVAKLITVKDERYTAAVSTAAGAGLYNVVVDTEETGKQLLTEVSRRVTIIPLNNINNQTYSKAQRDIAKDVGDAILALELVGYDPDIENAMRYLFGKKFVCESMDIATAVSFNKDLRAISVTVDGEVVQPGGLMTGGSTSNLDKTLLLYSKYLQKRDLLESERKELRGLEKEAVIQGQARARYDDHKQALETQQRLVSSIEYKLKTNTHHQVTEIIHELESKIKSSTEDINNGNAEITNLKSEIAKLEARSKEGGDTTNQRKEVEVEIAETKKIMKDLQPKRAAAKRAIAEANATEQEMQADLERLLSDMTEEEDKLLDLKEIVKKVRRELTIITEQTAAKEEFVNEMKLRVDNANTGITSKKQELSKLKDREGDLCAQREKLALKAAELTNMSNSKKQRLKESEQSDFVKQNIANFGKKGGEFDWRSINYKKEFAKLESLKVAYAKMSKSVNHKVVALFDTVVAQYKDVLSKREQVQKDKEHVISTIEDLNEQKKKTISETFAKVSVDFAEIFSTLLPGAKANLKADYKDDKEAIAGISIRVAMGNSWKENLSELSGGQKSLLALSYILALLKYKPAPVYILDEVDAALDASHTQNIGRMLATHFKNSQFLVVSLKEGMFNNANVLFKVRLAYGQSQVTRHDNTVGKQMGKKRGRAEAP
eukprot:TRINITY_DN6622_c0_g3_i1.p1 TRINITY_DN6622_c0_g3~~TRINITY_DN6622_c0_g3_i1.p1  ORF type:complete len:1210 (+),score=310.95 TRINITY_DN6622_c0_g3_i1:65-3631(+)